ncbi:MAG: hypothetical protein LBH81_03405 [Rickettsiales bacterium]|jgi:hypothetical protein|nr:hypothetical protein [Rickettsiales bacterium]
MTKKLIAFGLIMLGTAGISAAAPVNPELRSKFETACLSMEGAEFEAAQEKDNYGRLIDKCQFAFEGGPVEFLPKSDEGIKNARDYSNFQNKIFDSMDNAIGVSWQDLESERYILLKGGHGASERGMVEVSFMNEGEY